MPSKSHHKQQSISDVLTFPNRIQNTLIFYYLFPVLILFVSLSSYFYISTKNSLDEELGKRLSTVADQGARQIKPIQFLSLETTGAAGETFKLIQKRFESMADELELDRMYLLNRQGSMMLDTNNPDNVGIPFERKSLHQLEMQQAFAGQTTASTLFKGKDGYYYKTAFAPIKDRNANVIAIVGVDGNAVFFENLRKLETRLIGSGFVFVLIILIISFLLSKKIVAPIELLTLAAKRIGDGQIEEEILVASKNEVGFLSYVMDEMRKKILERDQSLQVMLRGIAHEVRNPLGGIELFAGILKDQNLDHKSEEAVTKIQSEVANLKKLVDEFLHFAKKPAIQLQSCDLQEFFEDIQYHWKDKLIKEHIEWSIGIKDADSVIWDIEQMRRVFHNLIENAMHAMKSDPKQIRIESRSQQQHLIIEVKDTGVGIQDADQKNLFKPFFTTKTFGNGLGLAMVQKIVQAHGGDVEIESIAHEGTTVRILFPLLKL